MKIALSAQLLKIESKPDRTLMLKINTQEPSPEEVAQLFSKNMEQIYLVILDEKEVNNESF